jgi:GNAT superfamily N-acetyltransferase
MTLDQTRAAIRHLLVESSPVDGMAAYFALRHPAAKSCLVTAALDGGRANGYVALSRTGIDLLRPFVTWRLPPDLTEARELIYRALPPETPVILHILAADLPLTHALFDIQSEELLRLYRLDAAQFQPIINALVTAVEGPNNLRRYVILGADEGERRQVVAAAGLNWESPTFAEIAVHAHPGYRRRGLGRSVVSALAQDLLASGHIPLYAAAETNVASLELATQLGFADTGARLALIEGSLRPDY